MITVHMSVIVSSDGCSVNRPHVGILRLRCVAYTALLHDSIPVRVGPLFLSLVPPTRRCCGRPERSPRKSPLCGWPTDRWPARPAEIQRKRSGQGVVRTFPDNGDHRSWVGSTGRGPRTVPSRPMGTEAAAGVAPGTRVVQSAALAPEGRSPSGLRTLPTGW